MTGPIPIRSTIELGGKTATGLPFPEEVVHSLGQGRRPAVIVTIGRHSYRSTIASMGERSLVPLSAENRAADSSPAGHGRAVGGQGGNRADDGDDNQAH